MSANFEKEYFLCKMIGKGTDEDPYRPAVADAPFADGAGWAVCAISADGKWATVVVDGNIELRNHALKLSDSPLGKKTDSVLQSLTAMKKHDLIADFVDQFVKKEHKPFDDFVEEEVQ